MQDEIIVGHRSSLFDRRRALAHDLLRAKPNSRCLPRHWSERTSDFYPTRMIQLRVTNLEAPDFFSCEVPNVHARRCLSITNGFYNVLCVFSPTLVCAESLDGRGVSDSPATRVQSVFYTMAWSRGGLHLSPGLNLRLGLARQRRDCVRRCRRIGRCRPRRDRSPTGLRSG